MGLDVGIIKKLKNGTKIDILQGRRDYNLVFCESFCKELHTKSYSAKGKLDSEGISKILKYCEDAYNDKNEDYKDEYDNYAIDEHLEHFQGYIKEEDLPRLRKEYWKRHIDMIKKNFDPIKDKDAEFEYYWSE